MCCVRNGPKHSGLRQGGSLFFMSLWMGWAQLPCLSRPRSRTWPRGAGSWLGLRHPRWLRDVWGLGRAAWKGRELSRSPSHGLPRSTVTRAPAWCLHPEATADTLRPRQPGLELPEHHGSIIFWSNHVTKTGWAPGARRWPWAGREEVHVVRGRGGTVDAISKNNLQH